MKTQTAVLEKTHHGEFCVCEGGVKYAGLHLLIEVWQARYLTDPSQIRKAFIQAIDACGATLLGMDLHVFSPNGGVSGVAVLQESHLSIHTWPEYEYAAIDIFVCGTINPHLILPVLEDAFRPKKMEVREFKRGILS